MDNSQSRTISCRWPWSTTTMTANFFQHNESQSQCWAEHLSNCKKPWVERFILACLLWRVDIEGWRLPAQMQERVDRKQVARIWSGFCTCPLKPEAPWIDENWNRASSDIADDIRQIFIPIPQLVTERPATTHSIMLVLPQELSWGPAYTSCVGSLYPWNHELHWFLSYSYLPELLRDDCSLKSHGDKGRQGTVTPAAPEVTRG